MSIKMILRARWMCVLPILWITSSCGTTPPPPAIPAEQILLPLEVVLDNIQTTDHSYLVRIIGVTITGAYGGPPSARGYVNHLVKARVLERFRGPVIPEVTYSVMADADARPFMPDYPVIVSLCHAPDESVHIPDNGYISAVPPHYLEAIRQLHPEAIKSNICNRW
jgi:hypothetical protein